MKQGQIGIREFLISYQKLSKTIEPGVGYFDHPSSGFIRRICLFLLYFFPTLFHVRDIVSVHDRLVCRFTGISLVCAEILFDVFGASDNDFIKNQFKLCHIVTVGSGDDDR